MLRIVTGRAGCGKTAYGFAQMGEAGNCRPQLLLVPEQASFESEQRFCRENGNQAGLYGEVLSFTRLENRVLSLAGGGAEPVLDEGGRMLVLYGALKAVSGSLTVYAMTSRRPEFLNSLLTTMDELKSYCITAADLTRIGEETEGLDGDKLRDLGLIFGAYEAMTARGHVDPRDRLSRLAEKLKEAPYFENKDVYLDGFTDFTPQQTLVLEEMLRQAHSVTVFLSWDDAPGTEEVFDPARRTMAKLTRLAEKVHCPVQRERMPDAARGRKTPLRHMEANLFARDPVPYAGEWDESVTLTGLSTPRQEVRWAAGEIRRLVRAGDLRYRDIAVSARSMDRYRESIDGVFEEYGIPVFQSDRTEILQKPIFTLITAAMDAVNGGYTYEDMFRYLKTGLAGLEAEECDRLENYVFTWNLWGSRWTSDWQLHPEGYQKEFTAADGETLEELNALRERVITPLEKLRQGAKGTVRDQLLALYGFLEEIDLPTALEKRTARLLEQGEPELAREYSQLWDIFCQGLVQCEGLLGEQEMDFSELTRLLRLLFSRYTVGTIPASLDRVTAGDAQRLANRRCKVLFLLGADDGSIPQVTPGQGLLTDHDRVLLEGYGLELSPRVEEKFAREHTIVYTICTQPTDKLCVTWPMSGESGGEKRPSFLVERLRVLFPLAEVEGEAPLSQAELRALAAKDPASRKKLGSEYAHLFEKIDRAAAGKRGNLSRQAVADLYGSRVPMSASRMDQHNKCHFAYFLLYGLKAKERRVAGFDAPEYGTFVHEVLEYVLREATQKGGVPHLKDEEIAQLTRDGIDHYVRHKLGGMTQRTPRFQYLFHRLEKNVRAVVENVVDELRASKFQPMAFELGFGRNKDLPPVEISDAGVKLSITGSVDRVDGWEKGKDLYLKVVDYKTGKKAFDLTEVWNGIGLQMLLYLFALEDGGRAYFGQDPIAAGVLYLPARDAAVAASRDLDDAKLRELSDEKLERKGLILADEEVVEAMEHWQEKPRFLPVRVKERTGEIYGGNLVSPSQMKQLKEHTERILKQICQDLAQGNIDADPFWRGPRENACEYCVYARACQFDETKDRRRWAPTVSEKDFWQQVAAGAAEAAPGEEEKGGGDDGSTEN